MQLAVLYFSFTCLKMNTTGVGLYEDLSVEIKSYRMKHCIRVSRQANICRIALKKSLIKYSSKP